MRRLVYLASARRDLAHILDHVTRSSGSLAVGLGFVAELTAKCERLAALPGLLGRARAELRSDIRSFPLKGYLIFFRYCDEAFEVVGVISARRDVEEYFRQDGE